MPEKHGVLIAVYPPRIKLEGEPLPKDINFWVGGECMEREAWKRSSNCRGPRGQWPHDRYEIFLLFEGEKLALYDRQRVASFITIIDDKPVLKPATPQDMVEYLHQVGMKQRSHRAIDWAVHNIEMLGETYGLRIGDMLRELRKKQKQCA